MTQSNNLTIPCELFFPDIFWTGNYRQIRSKFSFNTTIKLIANEIYSSEFTVESYNEIEQKIISFMKEEQNYS
ncbi:hypothetical protein NEF87_002530 [Candidatus Lokiarchaeum ossiferum]|uniref:Uncharacterized protein n=1 Tax=Candidatus Lokiarchaeum ossiferum TaxID=2951803 RepID=A0ABY6HRV6_9ARCH|nr:hypothetical protein NEF87_002530 [Candidatus Lokiarchaeum sp. B-35]